MADQARGERMIRIFVYMMAHYNNRYSVADIMRHLDIREEDLRSVQRDMHALSEIEGGYIRRSVESGKTYYQVALERANKLVFPEFGDRNSATRFCTSCSCSASRTSTRQLRTLSKT